MDEFSTPSVNIPARQMERVGESKASVSAHGESFFMQLVRKRRQDQDEEHRQKPEEHHQQADVFETEDGRQSESEAGTVMDFDEPGTVIDIKA
jgi:hypothetical protein